jgi:hypothetical protein
MQLRLISFTIAALVALFACKKDPKTKPALGAEPPPDLIAVVDLPNGTSLPQLSTFLDRVSGGKGALAAGAMGGQLTSLIAKHVRDAGSIDTSAPIRLLLMDPNTFEQPYILIAEDRGSTAAAEGVTLIKNGSVVGFGPRQNFAPDVTDFVRALAGEKPPSSLRATVFPKPLQRALAPKLAEIGAESGLASQEIGKLLTFYKGMLAALANEGEAITVEMVVAGADATVRTTLRARPKTKLAEFFAAQKPDDFDGLQRLPNLDATFVLAGHLDLGTSTDWLADLLPKMWSVPANDPRLQSVLTYTRQILPLITGDFAASAYMNPMSIPPDMVMAGTWEVTDGKKVLSLMKEMLSALGDGKPLELMGMTQTATFRPDVFEHAGVMVSEQETKIEGKLRGAPPMQISHMAVTGTTMLFAAAGDNDTPMRKLIDAHQGKGPAASPSQGQSSAVARGKRNKASVLIYVDTTSIGSMVGPLPFSGVAVELAFAGNQASMDLTIFNSAEKP